MDRLGDAGARDLRGDDVLLAERGEHRLQVAEVLAADLGRGLVELGRVRVDVLRQVDEMALGRLRVDDVGRLDDARQRHAAVGDVQRVVRAHALAHAGDEADDAEVALLVGPERAAPARAPACAAGWDGSGWPRRCRAGGSRRRARRRSRGGWRTARTAPGSRQHRAAARADAVREPVDERLVAALDRAHDLVALAVTRARDAVHARPQVGGRQVVVAAVELGVEQRAPQALPQAVAARAAGPRLQPELVELRVVVDARQRRTKRTSRARSAGDRPGNVSSCIGVDISAVLAVVVEAAAEPAPADVDARARARGRARAGRSVVTAW